MRHLLALGAFLTLAPATGAFAQQAPATAALAPQAPATAAAAEQADEGPPGQRTLNLCRACHTLNQGQRTLIGPNLYGVFGRRAASVEGFRYSANMRQLGSTGHTWSEETLRPYLTNPKAVVPQGAMSFPGIAEEKQLNELIAYLKQMTGGS